MHIKTIVNILTDHEHFRECVHCWLCDKTSNHLYIFYLCIVLMCTNPIFDEKSSFAESEWKFCCVQCTFMRSNWQFSLDYTWIKSFQSIAIILLTFPFFRSDKMHDVDWCVHNWKNSEKHWWKSGGKIIVTSFP